ncbi:MAG: hypothetical protein WAM85_21860 [Terracidiphilus sp.]
MNNPFNLGPTERRQIEELTPEQLKTIRANIQDRSLDEDETKTAVAQYLADGGELKDLLNA